MSEWKKVRLGDVCELNYGKGLTATKRVSGNVPVYSSAGITGHHNQCLINNKGIIIGRKGTVGSVYISETPFYCIDTAYYVLPNDEKYNLIYLYYRLKSLNLDKLNEDSAVPGLNRETAYSQEFSLPPLPEQTRIANILSSLDDKIELNNRINKNLEEQAQALFKQWFVDFEFPNTDGKPYRSNGGEMIESELGMIPKGWKVGKLGEYVDSIDNRGKTPPLSNEVTYFPIIDVRALSGGNRVINYNNCSKFVDEETYHTWFRNGHPKQYDILISTVGSLAEMKLFFGTIGCIAQNVIDFRAKNISPLYLFEFLKNKKNDLISYNIGSVQPSIKVTHIIKHEFLIPNKGIVDIFDNQIKSFSLTIYNNEIENQKLTRLRDALLPRLMNGKIKMKGD